MAQEKRKNSASKAAAISAEVITLQELKKTNTLLAASAQQDMRDKGLDKITQILITEQRWVEEEQPSQQKHLRVIWEGLFFMFWHADKSVYQQSTALRIAKLMEGIRSDSRKQQWFQACIYILNKHWDKIDNFRIDKFLSLLRQMFAQVLTFLKSKNYEAGLVQWLQNIMQKLFLDAHSAQGIALQICDVFIPELGKVDKDGISMDQIGQLVQPFLKALARSSQSLLTERVLERVFEPLLESNVTMPDSDDSESSEEDLTAVDGGKLSKRSRKAVAEVINQKYVFPAFNILLYAENYIFPQASAKPLSESPEDGIEEVNREMIYDLYYKALKLEPEPKHPELTFSQRQLMNRARKFITMKMKRRMELSKTKKSKKERMKARKLLSDSLMKQLRARMEQQMSAQGEDGDADSSEDKQQGQVEEKATAPKKVKSFSEDDDEEPVANVKKSKKVQKADTGNVAEFALDNSSYGVEKQADAGSTLSDEVIVIPAQKPKKKKKSKAQRREEAAAREQASGVKRRRVVFKPENNITREFHKHSKVATRVLPNSSAPQGILKSAIKKPREAKQASKADRKVAKFAQ